MQDMLGGSLIPSWNGTKDKGCNLKKDYKDMLAWVGRLPQAAGILGCRSLRYRHHLHNIMYVPPITYQFGLLHEL